MCHPNLVTLFLMDAHHAFRVMKEFPSPPACQNSKADRFAFSFLLKAALLFLSHVYLSLFGRMMRS